MRHFAHLLGLAVVTVVVVHAEVAHGQGYGTDLQNVMAPASGGMAGVSVARPQDVPSAIFGNPASLSQFGGTQFTLGGGWLEGYPTVTNDGVGNGGVPFSATSRSEGAVAPEIGVAQDLRSLGLPGALGIGVTALSGAGAEYRGDVPGSFINNASSEYLVLGVNLAAGFQVADRLSVGAAVTLGDGFEQMGLVGPNISSAMVQAFALRGTVGVNFELNDCNTLGFYYQSPLAFNYLGAARVGNNYYDVRVTQPTTFGWGIANRALMDGNLLIAADFYYKLWEDAALYQDLLVNQWAVAVGAQLTRDKMNYRVGYSFNSNPINHNVGTNFDNLPGPILASDIQLFQASSMPLVNQNRITGGIGRQLFSGFDVDIFAGGMFRASDNFGPHNSASLAVYYLGLGLTWRFDACRQRADADQ